MIGLRQKLSVGFGGLLVIILIIGVQSIIQLTKLGESIDVILRENYRSVIACQQMKEALERMDSGILFELLGYTEKGNEVIRKNELAFEMALGVELHNITLPGEGERASHLRNLFGRYKTTLRGIEDSTIHPLQGFFHLLTCNDTPVVLTENHIDRFSQFAQMDDALDTYD